LRGSEKFLDQGLMHVEDGIERTKAEELRDDSGAESRRENLWPCGTYLWSEDAHPDFFSGGLFGPETKEVLEVA
jgi:hypothetical protein